MFLRSIFASNFRSFDEINCTFSDDINIIYGPNGSGKTNFLEAIHFSFTGKSFRTKNDNNLIKWERDRIITEANYLKNGQKKFIKIIFSKDVGKEINLNGLNRQKFQSLFYESNLIVNTSGSVGLIKGEPSLKRHFLDRLSLKLNKEYSLILSRYNQTLKNRNALLKNYGDFKKSKNLFEILTEELINLSKIIQDERTKIVNRLNLEINKITSDFEEFKNLNRICIKYEPEEINVEKANSLIREELKRKTTLIGSHTDNVVVVDKDFSIKDFSSEGEQKLASILLKLCEYNILEEETKNVPILLIDDITSELDSKNIELILNHFKDRSQIFITALSDLNIYSGKVFRLPASSKVVNA